MSRRDLPTSRRAVLRAMGGALGAAGLWPLLPAAGCARAEPRPERPNVIVIMTDDQGYQDLGCYGSPDIATPHIDGLARDGTRFTDFYAAPQCTAARIAFMTGCYAPRVGDLRRTGEGTRVGIHEDEVTLAELLKAQGYATHLIGKWHLGMAPAFAPRRHGFDTFFGMLTSNGQRPPLMRGEEVLEADPDQSTLTERYTEEGLARIAQDRDRPFFLFLSHVMPHVPLSVSPRFRGRSARGLYGDAVECIDWSTGKLLAALAEHGLERRTLVVFTSDNGPWLSKGADGGSAAPFRGGKGQVLEGGVRVPCIMRWTGWIPAGGTTDAVCGLIDLMPTVAGLVSAELPADRVIDGRDIFPVAAQRPDARPPHEHFYFFRGGRLAAVRSDRWKYFLPRGEGEIGQLYDLSQDPGERDDLAAVRPDVVLAQREAATRFRAALEASRRPPGRARLAAPGAAVS